MKKTIAMLALGALLVLPAFAGAVHGSPYTANGIAIAPDGSVLNARVHWTGFGTPRRRPRRSS